MSGVPRRCTKRGGWRRSAGPRLADRVAATDSLRTRATYDFLKREDLDADLRAQAQQLACQAPPREHMGKARILAEQLARATTASRRRCACALLARAGGTGADGNVADGVRQTMNVARGWSSWRARAAASRGHEGAL